MIFDEIFNKAGMIVFYKSSQKSREKKQRSYKLGRHNSSSFDSHRTIIFSENWGGGGDGAEIVNS